MEVLRIEIFNKYYYGHKIREEEEEEETGSTETNTRF